MKRKCFSTLFICINLIIWIGMTSVYSSSINKEDLELKISNFNDNKVYFPGSTPLHFGVWLVNHAGIRQFNKIQNDISYGKEVKEEIIRVKIGTPQWKWDENLKIKVEKLTKIKGKVIREEKLKDINWYKYYTFPNQESKMELIGYRKVERTWTIPPDVTAKLEPGEYEITAIYDSRSVPDEDVIHKLITSIPLTIFIKKPATKREKAKALHEQASYYGDLEKAKKALRIDPTYYPAHLTLAGLYSHAGRYKEAIREYKIYLEEYLKDPTIPIAECGGKADEEYRINRFIKELERQLKKQKGDEKED
ncbi:MAG: tetratricopeptide repeat protein [bacterium]